MAAQPQVASRSSIPPSSRRSRPPISQTRLRAAPQDGDTTLALSLAAVRAAHRLDVIALCDLEGVVVASAGDRYAAEELAVVAAAAARETPERRAAILPRLGVIVDTLERAARTWVVAATTTVPGRDRAALLAAVEDVLPTADADEPEPVFELERDLDDDLFADLC